MSFREYIIDNGEKFDIVKLIIERHNIKHEYNVFRKVKLFWELKF